MNLVFVNLSIFSPTSNLEVSQSDSTQLYYTVIIVVVRPRFDFSSFSSSNDIENLGGPFGAWISDVLFVLFGIGAYIVLALLVSVSIEAIFVTAKYSSKAKSFFRFFGSLITILCACSLFEFYLDGDAYPELSAGGYIGNTVFIFLSGIFGQLGSLIFIILFLIPAFSLAFNFTWTNLIDKTGSFVIIVLKKLKEFLISLFNTIKNNIKTVSYTHLTLPTNREV